MRVLMPSLFCVYFFPCINNTMKTIPNLYLVQKRKSNAKKEGNEKLRFAAANKCSISTITTTAWTDYNQVILMAVCCNRK